MRSDVYYNLHRHCLSIRQNGLVVQHTPSAVLEDVSFVVQEAGRQRVLRQKRKNVHAFVRGSLVEASHTRPGRTTTQVFYNPYKAGCFRTADGDAVVGAKRVYITGKQMLAEGVARARRA